MTVPDLKPYGGQLDQPLVPGGETILWINDDHDLSVLTKPSANVDVRATLDIRDAPGVNAEGRPLGNRMAPLEALWRTVSYAEGTTTRTAADELSVRSDAVMFAGAFNLKPAAGRTHRLRLVIFTPAGLTGLVVHRFTVRGWYT